MHHSTHNHHVSTTEWADLEWFEDVVISKSYTVFLVLKTLSMDMFFAIFFLLFLFYFWQFWNGFYYLYCNDLFFQTCTSLSSPHLLALSSLHVSSVFGLIRCFFVFFLFVLDHFGISRFLASMSPALSALSPEPREHYVNLLLTGLYPYHEDYFLIIILIIIINNVKKKRQ